MHKLLTVETDRLFNDQHLVDTWMKGLITTEQIVAAISPSVSERGTAQSLLRRFSRDCRHMLVDPELISVVRALSCHVNIVIATDNVGGFAEALLRRAELASIVHGIVCSSQVGVLKAENPQRFFGDYLERRELQWRDAVLVDDREENCGAFLACGGSAVLVNSPKFALEALRRLLSLVAG